MCSVDWVGMDTLCQEVKLYCSMPLKETNAYQYEEKITSKRHQMEWNHIVCDGSYNLLLPHQRYIQRYHFLLQFTTTSSFCRAMLCTSAAIAGTRCPFVCPSVCHVRELRQNE